MSKTRYPYGPLTESNYVRLASSFYDSSRLDEQFIAEIRGISPTEYAGYEIGRILLKNKVDQPTTEVDNA